ncbi:MAG TPA: plastocyanin/azurin family copper-binding protein [Ktedonobacteraceae bacterium]
MNPGYTYRLRRARCWFGLLVLIVGALLLLTACGSSTTPGAGAVDSTNTAQIPTAVASSPTLTPTVAPITPTPVTGSTQMLMINNESNGSFGFSSATLMIKVGTIVIWKNMSLAPHTVTSDDGQTFDSGTVAVGGTFRFTFMNAGTFSYHCNIHPYMRATIIVV